ncbi:pullulanase [Amphibacillus indicireducens]|uniref:pullulanase n=1 Tax=Amphibacillus indicireducens TaxID=1076330 RepID=A0ABP7VC04_9BACI
MARKRRINRITALSMIFVLLLSMISSALPYSTISAETNEQAIPENHLRIHFENGDLSLDDLYVWKWGDVAEPSMPSDEAPWPEDVPFVKEQTTDFGGYVDILLNDNPILVEFQIGISGEAPLGDLEANLADLDTYEIWVTRDGTVYYEKPAEGVDPVVPVEPTPDRTLKVHYQNNDLDLDDLRLWYWGDIAAEPSGEWPNGEPFTDSQTTDYGGYVEIVSGVTESEEEIPEGYFRLHFEDIETSLFEQLNVSSLDELGLWLWDVAEDSVGWPNGAMNFSNAVKTDYGHYMEIELSGPGESFGFLINTTQGAQTDDFYIELLSQEMNEAWITVDHEIYSYQPLDIEDSIRVNYIREDGNYNGWGLWTWGDVAEATSDWPNGHPFEEGGYGSFYDLALAENAGEIGFLLVNRDTGEQTENMSFAELDQHTQIFVREGDPNVYTNPYFASVEGLRTAEVLTDSTIELVFSSVEGLTEQDLLEGLEIVNANGDAITDFAIEINSETDTVIVTVEAGGLLETAPIEIKYDGREATARVGWRLIDEMYAYDGDLGLNLRTDGSAELKLWSPSADAVNVVLYDKDDQERIIDDQLAMTLGERGVWSIELDESNTGITDLTGYYYHFEIERGGETVLALDPYARSMAAWDSSNLDNYVGKAAIVDPSTIGPELDFAEIDGYEKREDAIIYEVHVRDFTSDPSLEGELDSQFGTFSAFAEKLDYIESLGVTHIQLLPVMSYFFADEFNNDQRLLEYSSTDNNYNWGYDPHSYFSLTGMYSEDPEDPAKRIEEFKRLIDEIHDRGMGVILDVVYNHTARVHIFEDLEPNYYHFMDSDGTPRESFGGGRLGTTHEMARRILVDSITYWVEEYKVDGFRFDMMGDHDAETIQIAYDEAAAINPNILMIGEGWVTYVGDENYPNVQPADQHWMQYTQAVGSFSDEFRNELKSGFGHEGEPRFITGGARNIQQIYDNLTANPHNFKADDPGDVVPYIAAHDNLTLHDVIAQSIKKDPKDHAQEIHERIRLGNLMVLTAQGTPFIHAGQEFGRTKQFRHEDYIGEVPAAQAPYKSTFMTDENGTPFEYPYFIHDSYDSTDAVNKFDWAMATDTEAYPINTTTQSYTTGLIALRRSTDAFSRGTMEEIDQFVSMIEAPEIGTEDLVIGYQAIDSNGDIYAVFVNADTVSRQLTLATDYSAGDIIVDGQTAGTEPISNPTGVTLSSDSIELDPLTATVIRLTADSVEEVPEEKDIIEIKPNEPTQIAPEQTIKISDDNGKVAQIETPKSLPEGTIIEVDFLDESEMEGATSATGKSIAKAGQVVSVNIEYPEGYQVIEGEFFTLTLSYDSDSDWVAIFYKGNNADSWERLGGKMDRSTETITIEIPHFSTYGVFEDALEDVIADLEADIKDLNDKIANLEGNNTDLKQELSDLKAKVTEIETENQELLAMIAQILAEIERLEAQLAEQEITTPEDVPGQDQTDEGSEGDQPEESEGTEGSEDETSVDSTESKGDALPKTATALFNYLLIGTLMLIAGAGLALYTRRRRHKV